MGEAEIETNICKFIGTCYCVSILVLQNCLCFSYSDVAASCQVLFEPRDCTFVRTLHSKWSSIIGDNDNENRMNARMTFELYAEWDPFLRFSSLCFVSFKKLMIANMVPIDCWEPFSIWILTSQAAQMLVLSAFDSRSYFNQINQIHIICTRLSTSFASPW